MNQLYYVDHNGVLSAVTAVIGFHRSPTLNVQHIPVIDDNDILMMLNRSMVHSTKLSALEAQRTIFEKEATVELQNIFHANQRHTVLMNRLVDIDVELYGLRKGEGLPPITDTQVKL